MELKKSFRIHDLGKRKRKPHLISYQHATILEGYGNLEQTFTSSSCFSRFAML